MVFGPWNIGFWQAIGALIFGGWVKSGEARKFLECNLFIWGAHPIGVL